MAKIKETISSNGSVIHCGVGAVIEKNNKYLLIDRAITPFGFGCICGHINEGENPEKALIREIKEELGLNVSNYKLVLERELKNRGCSIGRIPHYCYIFECEVNGEININQKEVKSAGWYSKEEIKKLNLEPLWKFYFKKIKVI